MTNGLTNICFLLSKYLLSFATSLLFLQVCVWIFQALESSGVLYQLLSDWLGLIIVFAPVIFISLLGLNTAIGLFLAEFIINAMTDFVEWLRTTSFRKYFPLVFQTFKGFVFTHLFGWLLVIFYVFRDGLGMSVLNNILNFFYTLILLVSSQLSVIGLVEIGCIFLYSSFFPVTFGVVYFGRIKPRLSEIKPKPEKGRPPKTNEQMPKINVPPKPDFSQSRMWKPVTETENITLNKDGSFSITGFPISFSQADFLDKINVNGLTLSKLKGEGKELFVFNQKGKKKVFKFEKGEWFIKRET